MCHCWQTHRFISTTQQKTEVTGLKCQMSSLVECHTATLESTLTAEIARLEKTVMKPCLEKLEMEVSRLLSEQLKSFSPRIQSSSLPGMRTGDSGIGGTQVTTTTTPPHSHTTTPHHPESNGLTSQTLCTDEKGTITQPLRRVQIKRKRKPAEPRGDSGALAESQRSSEEDQSTPCDIDLTQHSPSGCSQVITNNVKQLRHTITITTGSTATTSSEKRVPQSKEGKCFMSSPPRGPVSKKRRPTGRVSRQKGLSGTLRKGRVMATPRITTRRSQRLSKPVIPQQQYPESYHEAEETVAQVKAEPVEDSTSGGGGGGGGEGGRGLRGGDVLEDWLGLQPSDTQESGDTQPQRFQRSSEAARRRLAVTEQMSLTLAGSDSVLRELFLSDPYTLSP